MRLGRIEFNIGYVVDLDNEDMVAAAKEAIYEDVQNAANEGVRCNIIHNSKLNKMTEGDIPSFLLDDDLNDEDQY